MFTSLFHLVPRVRISGAEPLLPLYALMGPTRDSFTFYLFTHVLKNFNMKILNDRYYITELDTHKVNVKKNSFS